MIRIKNGIVSVTIVTISTFLTFSLFLNQYFHKIRLLPISFLFFFWHQQNSFRSELELSFNQSLRESFAELGPKVGT